MLRLSELQYGIELEGPQVKLDQIEGSLVTIQAVGFFDSDFAPGAAVQIVHGEESAWLLTYSQVVIETLAKFVDQLPFEAMFSKRQSAAGRTFWTVE